MTIRLTQRSSRKIIGRSTTVISPKKFDRIVKLPYSSITQPLEGKGGTVAVIDPVDLSAPINRYTFGFWVVFSRLRSLGIDLTQI